MTVAHIVHIVGDLGGLGRTAQVFCRVSLRLGLPGAVPHSYTGQRTVGQVPLLSHHVKGSYCQHDFSLLTLPLITWLGGWMLVSCVP